MKRALIVALGVTLVVARSAAAAPIVYVGSLNGANEEPPNASPATGSTIVTVDPVAHTLTVEIAFSGLLGTSTAAHIHVINGPGDTNLLDTNGPVATTTPFFLGFPVGVTAGSMNFTYSLLDPSSFRAGFITDSGGVAQAEAELLNALASGRAYLNVHSTVFGGGEIRDFLEPKAVPAPGAPILVSLGTACWAMRRRVFHRAR